MFSYLIVRRIDDLGRICIPKEMRRDFGVEEGDALKIELREGEIVIRKHNNSYKKEIERLRDMIIFDEGKSVDTARVCELFTELEEMLK